MDETPMRKGSGTPPEGPESSKPASRVPTAETPQVLPDGAPVTTELLRDAPASMREVPDTDQLMVIRAKDPALIGTRIPLRTPTTLVGRRRGAHVMLPFDEAVSGRHARFVRKDGGWSCADEGSRNGTFVNGKPITEPVKLTNGAQVQIGTTTFTFLVGAGGAAHGGRELPYPIAVSSSVVAHQAGPFARVKALLDAIETTLRFIVAAELAVAREAGGDATDAAAAELAQLGSMQKLLTLSMGQWESLAARLARVAVEGSDPRIAEVARALINRRGERSTLGERLRQVVAFRNKQIGHGKILSEDAFRADEEPLGATFAALVEAVRPLAEHRLVSVADVEFRGAKIAYTLYAHQGPLEYFPTFKEDLAAPLEKRWCYLLRDELPPLSLAPVVLADASPASRKLEVFLSDGIVLGPEGAGVTAHGVTSNASVVVELQWNEAAAALYAKMAGRDSGRRG